MIVAEDMSPRVGVYDDALAKTPSIDRLANEGVMYTNMHTISGSARHRGLHSLPVFTPRPWARIKCARPKAD